jgi:hypothetical protein
MPREIISEKVLEQQTRKAVSSREGHCLKLLSPWFTGFPDRTILLPGGRIGFAEIKTTGKPLSARQKVVRALLEGMGFPYFKIDDENSLEIFTNWLDKP